jgi:hypothetical protein
MRKFSSKRYQAEYKAAADLRGAAQAFAESVNRMGDADSHTQIRMALFAAAKAFAKIAKDFDY